MYISDVQDIILRMSINGIINVRINESIFETLIFLQFMIFVYDAFKERKIIELRCAVVFMLFTRNN